VAVINPGALAFLMGKGLDLNHRDKYGRTPLHEGCEKGRASSVGILMAAGADPGILDGKGLLAWQLGGGRAASMLRVFHEKKQIEAASKVAWSSKKSRL
jgi:ankyrin repeat protein